MYPSAGERTPMRTVRYLVMVAVSVLAIGGATGLFRVHGASTPAPPMAAATPNGGVAPQSHTAHVYVAPEDFYRLVPVLLGTVGGPTTKQGVFTVTPTPSTTMSQLVLTPAGTVSVFGFKTPIPYPFGAERTGYLVTDMDTAIHAARATGADVIVTPFNDPIG